jgi:hypothetical protein
MLAAWFATLVVHVTHSLRNFQTQIFLCPIIQFVVYAIELDLTDP